MDHIIMAIAKVTLLFINELLQCMFSVRFLCIEKQQKGGLNLVASTLPLMGWTIASLTTLSLQSSFDVSIVILLSVWKCEWLALTQSWWGVNSHVVTAHSGRANSCEAVISTLAQSHCWFLAKPLPALSSSDPSYACDNKFRLLMHCVRFIC